MLESILCSTLSKYLNTYFESVHEGDVVISLWNGEMRLSNIKVKKEVLMSLELPVTVKSVSIASIYLSIPWSHLSTSPMKLYVDGIEIVISDCAFLGQRRQFSPESQPTQGSRSTVSSDDSNSILGETEDDSLMKLVSLFANNCSIAFTNLHLRYEHSTTHYPSSLNMVDIQLEKAGIDLINSTEHRLSCDVSSAIYKSYCVSGLKGTLSSADTKMDFIKDVDITGEFGIDLRSTEDRWPECEMIVERIMNEVDSQDRESLGDYIRGDYSSLVKGIVQCETMDAFSDYLNEHAPKTLSSHTHIICSRLLYDLLKVPPPVFAMNIMIHVLSIQLDKQHLLYLSDMLGSYSDHEKDDDTASMELTNQHVDNIHSNNEQNLLSDSSQMSTHRSLLASFLAYHILSSYPTFILMVLTLILFPFWLYSAFLPTIGGLLCIGSGLLYLNRWVIDQHEEKTRRKDCQRDRHSSSLQLHVQTEEIGLEVTTTELSSNESIVSNVFALRMNTLEGDIQMDKRELSVDMQVQAVALEDLMITPSSFLLGSSSERTWEEMKQRSSPFLSIHYHMSSPSAEDNLPSSQLIRIRLDSTIINYNQSTLVAGFKILSLIPPSSAPSAVPVNGEHSSLNIEVSAASLTFVEQTDGVATAILSMSQLGINYKNNEKTSLEVTGTDMQVLNATSQPVLQAPTLDLNMIFTPDSATVLHLVIPDIHGVFQYLFIMSVVYTITHGEFLMSFYGEESNESEVATDFSQCLYLDIHCPSPRLTLPLSDSNGILLTSHEVSVCTGERCVLFNSIVITADTLSINDSVPVLALSELQCCFRYSDTMTRMNINTTPVSIVLAPYSLRHVIHAFSSCFMDSTQTLDTKEVMNDDEIILTEVVDSETDDLYAFTKDPTFAVDVSLQSISILLVTHPDDSYDDMTALYEASMHNSILEIQFSKGIVNYKSSPCDIGLDLSIHSFTLIDHDVSSVCPVDRRHFIVIGSDSDPMVRGKILLVDNSSKLFCDVHLGASQIQVTPFLLSLPSILLKYLPESDSSSQSAEINPSDRTIVSNTSVDTASLIQSSSQQAYSLKSPDSGVFGCDAIMIPSSLDHCIKASVSLHPIHIFLFSLDEKDATTLDLSFSALAEAHAANSSLTGSIQLTDLSVKKVNEADEPDLFSTLMLPVSFSIVIGMKNRFNELSLTLTGTPCTMVVGSADISFIVSLYESLLDQPSSDMDKSPTSQSEEESSLWLLGVHLQLKSVLPRIRLVLVSNSYQSLIPVATVELQSIAFSIQSINQSVTMISRVTLCGQVFKKSIGKWEMAIEPWQLNGRFDQSVHKLDVRIDTMDLLNVNITSSILATLNSYFLEVNHALQLRHTCLLSMYEVAPRQKEIVSTYSSDKSVCNHNYVCFVNHSGCLVYVDISDGHESALTRTQTSFVTTDGQALYSTILSYPSFQQILESDTIEDSYKEVTIHCDGYSSASFPMYSDCEVCLWPLSSVNPFNILVAHSQVSFGRKEILVSGRISVENCSGLDLFYGFDTQATCSERGFTRPLERFSVDCKVYAPSTCCVNGVLSLSLGASFSIYEQSAVAKIPVSTLEQSTRDSFIVSVGRKQQCIRVHVNRETVGMSKGSRATILKVLLLPCLVIQNQLPTAITITLSDVTDTRDFEETTIQQGDSYDVYSVPVDLGSCILSASLAENDLHPHTEALHLGVQGLLQFNNAVVRFEVFRRSDSVIVLQLFSDFWIMNKLEDGIIISENASDEKCLYYAEPHPMYFMADKTAIPQPTPFLPLLFSFSTPRLKDGKGNRDVVMKIPGYDWSSPFSIDTVNLDGCVEMVSVSDDSKGVLSVSIHYAPGNYGMTKIVTISPMYILVNNTSSVFGVRQTGCPMILDLFPSEPKGWFWPDADEKPMIQFMRDDGISLWTDSVTLSLGEQMVAIRTSEVESLSENDDCVLRIFSAIQNHQMIVTLEYADPFNKRLFLYRQQGTVTPEAIKNMLLNRPVSLPPDTLHQTLTSRFTKAFHLFSRHKRPPVTDESDSSDAEPSDVDPVTLSVSVSITGMGLSIINDHPEEVLFLVIKGIDGFFSMFASKKITSEFSLGRIQIDNCLSDTRYPVLLGSPIHSPLYGREGDSNRNNQLFDALVNMRRTENVNPNESNRVLHCVVRIPYHPSVVYIEKFDLEVQELDIAIESKTIYAILDLLKAIPDTEENRIISQQSSNTELLKEYQLVFPVPSLEVSRLYYFTEELYLHAIRTKLSFRSTSQYPITGSLLKHHLIPKFVKAIVDAAGNVVSTIDNASLNLPSFEAKSLYISVDDMLNKLTQHYILQTRVRLYKILGAVNILGNPGELLMNIGQGLRAFIDEPLSGLKQGPGEFIDGVGKGTKQLLSNTTFGLLNSVEKFTDTLVTGVETLTMSEEYKADRAAGKKGLMHGMRSGVAGFFNDIRTGNQNRGVTGAIGGVGKGVVGMITKPIGGLLDETSNIVGKMKDIAKVEATPVRYRAPRCLRFDSSLQPYDGYLANGQQFMSELYRRNYIDVDERYVVHTTVSAGSLILFFTTKRMLIVDPYSRAITWSEQYNLIETMGSQTHFLFMRGSEKNGHGKKNKTDIPIQCSFNTCTLMYVIEDFLKQARHGLSLREISMFRDHVCVCSEHYPIQKDWVLYPELIWLQPNPIPIEEVSMMNEQMSLDMLRVSETPIQWKVCGCGYSWIVTMTIHDIHYLYDSLFSNQYRLNTVEPSIPADADDLAVLKEIKDLLARNHSLLVTLPVERVFKQNYRAFQYSK